MLNILMADDDNLFLTRLTGLLNSLTGIPLHILGWASDGCEAVEMLQRLKPNLILLDMDMPKATGVDVGGFILQKGLNVKILALSNYDNLEYVRPILRQGAIDYLPKHELTGEVLREKLLLAEALILREQAQAQHMELLSCAAKQELLQKLIFSGGLSPEERSALRGQPEFASNTNVLICMQILDLLGSYHKDSSDRRGRIIKSVLEICTNVLIHIRGGISAYIADGEFVLLPTDHECSLRRIQELSRSACGLLKTNLQKNLNVQSRLEAAYFDGGIDSIHGEYRALHSRLHGENDELLGLEEEKKIVDALYRFDCVQLEKVVTALFRSMEEQGAPPSRQELLATRIFSILVRFLQNQHITQVPQEMERAYLRFFSGDLGLLEPGVLLCCSCAIKIAGAHSRHMYSAIVQAALQKIDSSYHRDLSLQETAGHCGVSEAYLSRVFKMETGFSFVSYLNHYRIQLSTELLRDNSLPIKEIYQQTGFRNYSYFIKLFKEHTGTTPAAFQREPK